VKWGARVLRVRSVSRPKPISTHTNPGFPARIGPLAPPPLLGPQNLTGCGGGGGGMGLGHAAGCRNGGWLLVATAPRGSRGGVGKGCRRGRSGHGVVTRQFTELRGACSYRERPTATVDGERVDRGWGTLLDAVAPRGSRGGARLGFRREEYGHGVEIRRAWARGRCRGCRSELARPGGKCCA